MRRRRGTGAVLAVVAALSPGLFGACSGRSASAAPLKPVPANLVPATLPGAPGDPPLTIDEYKEGSHRIDAARGHSVIGHGQVWEVRRGTTLVGALEIATLQPKVDISDPKERQKLAGLIVSGSIQRIVVSGVEVVAARTADKIVFLWFGNQLFEVLQVKGAGIRPDTILKSILDFQKPSGQLRIKSAS